jgi:hypothetical protein
VCRESPTDRWCPRRSRYEAKGVPRRVCKVAITASESPRTHFEHLRFSIVDVFDHDVKVKLLRVVRIGTVAPDGRALVEMRYQTWFRPWRSPPSLYSDTSLAKPEAKNRRRPAQRDRGSQRPHGVDARSRGRLCHVLSREGIDRRRGHDGGRLPGLLDIRYSVRSQPVDATASTNASDGDRPPRVRRGRPLSSRATALSCA